MKDDASSDLWDSALVQYGVGAFETMLSNNANIHLLPYHLERIKRFGIEWGVDSKQIEDKFTEQLVDLPKGKYRVKVLIGLNNKEEVIAHRYTYPFQEKKAAKKLLLIKTFGRQTELYKSCNYAFHYKARKKAFEDGFDDICYEQDGVLLECSTSTILCLKQDEGIVALENNLQSVSAAKLLSHREGFWKKGIIKLEYVDRLGSLFTSSALHGCVPVNSIVNEDGKTLYEMKEFPSYEKWNKFLFEDE